MSCLGSCFGKKVKDTVMTPIRMKSSKDRIRHKSIENIGEHQASVIRKLSMQSPENLRSLNELNKNTLARNSSIRKTFLNSYKNKQENSSFFNPKKSLREINNQNSVKTRQTNSSVKPHWEFKDKLRCLFCGGASCKHENWRKNKKAAIIGLNCDYITEDLIASQRPSTTLINEYNLIKKFKEERIGLIVNLQREGEHPYCGPNRKLELSSGFTYEPQVFISEDINVKLAGWKDMSVPDSLNFVLETVKEMAVTIKENNKKILVHCHAGYGRTGVIIACYIIFDTNMETEDVVSLLRSKRHGTIQKKSQYTFCNRFREYITRAKQIFLSHKITIENYMKNQKDILYGEEYYKYEYIPKIISESLDKIIEFKSSGKYKKTEIHNSMYYLEKWTNEQEEVLQKIKMELNKNNWKEFKALDSISILSQLVYDWLEDSIINIINPEKIDLIFEEKGLAYLISKQLEDYEYFNKESRKKLADSIKKDLRTIEFETLICLANFSNELRPDNKYDRQAMNDYYNMLRRLSIQILGFPSKAIYPDNPNENSNLINYNHCNTNYNNNPNNTTNTNNINNNHNNTLFFKSNNYLNNTNNQISNISGKGKLNKRAEKTENADNSNFEISDNKDDILFYGDCVIDLIEFLGLIIKLDLNDQTVEENISIGSPKVHQKVFSPYITRRKHSEVQVDRKTSFIGISRYAKNMLRESTIKNSQGKTQLNLNNIINSNDSESLNSDKSEYENKGTNQKFLFHANKHHESGLTSAFELKQCIREESDEDNCLNTIVEKESKKNGSFLIRKSSLLNSNLTKKNSFNNNNFNISTKSINNTPKNNNILNLNLSLNEANEKFFKEIYKTLNNHFNGIGTSSSPATSNNNNKLNEMDRLDRNNNNFNTLNINNNNNNYGITSSSVNNEISEFMNMMKSFFKGQQKNINVKMTHKNSKNSINTVSKFTSRNQSFNKTFSNDAIKQINANEVLTSQTKNDNSNPNFYYVSQINLSNKNKSNLNRIQKKEDSDSGSPKINSKNNHSNGNNSNTSSSKNYNNKNAKHFHIHGNNISNGNNLGININTTINHNKEKSLRSKPTENSLSSSKSYDYDAIDHQQDDNLVSFKNSLVDCRKQIKNIFEDNLNFDNSQKKSSDNILTFEAPKSAETQAKTSSNLNIINKKNILDYFHNTNLNVQQTQPQSKQKRMSMLQTRNENFLKNLQEESSRKFITKLKEKIYEKDTQRSATATENEAFKNFVTQTINYISKQEESKDKNYFKNSSASLNSSNTSSSNIDNNSNNFNSGPTNSPKVYFHTNIDDSSYNDKTFSIRKLKRNSKTTRNRIEDLPILNLLKHKKLLNKDSNHQASPPLTQRPDLTLNGNHINAREIEYQSKSKSSDEHNKISDYKNKNQIKLKNNMANIIPSNIIDHVSFDMPNSRESKKTQVRSILASSKDKEVKEKTKKVKIINNILKNAEKLKRSGESSKNPSSPDFGHKPNKKPQQEFELINSEINNHNISIDNSNTKNNHQSGGNNNPDINRTTKPQIGFHSMKDDQNNNCTDFLGSFSRDHDCNTKEESVSGRNKSQQTGLKNNRTENYPKPLPLHPEGKIKSSLFNHDEGQRLHAEYISSSQTSDLSQ